MGKVTNWGSFNESLSRLHTATELSQPTVFFFFLPFCLQTTRSTKQTRHYHSQNESAVAIERLQTYMWDLANGWKWLNHQLKSAVLKSYSQTRFIAEGRGTRLKCVHFPELTTVLSYASGEYDIQTWLLWLISSPLVDNCDLISRIR